MAAVYAELCRRQPFFEKNGLPACAGFRGAPTADLRFRHRHWGGKVYGLVDTGIVCGGLAAMPVLQAIRSVCTEFRPAAVFALCAPQRVFMDRDLAHGASGHLEDTRNPNHFRSDRHDDRTLAGGGHAAGCGLLCRGTHTPFRLSSHDLSLELCGLGAHGFGLCDLGDHGRYLCRDGQDRRHQHAAYGGRRALGGLLRRPLLADCDQRALGCGADPNGYF